MMELISKFDPEYFEKTCDKPYDRHQYRLDFKEGKSIIFDDYDYLRVFWFEQIKNWNNCTVTILDREQSKKGFGN